MRLILLATTLILASPAIAGGTSPKSFTLEDVVPTICHNREPNLVVGPSGTLHVVYFHDNFSGGRGKMRYVSRPAGGAWSAPIDVADNGAHWSTLVLAPGEIPFASWSDGNGQSGQTENVRVLQGGVWVDFGTPLPSGCFGYGGMGGALVIDSSGHPGLAYFDGCAEDAVYSEWSTPWNISGGSWTTTIVESAGRVGKGMACALTSDGRPMVAYMDQDQNEVHFCERGANGNWQAIEVLPGSAGGAVDIEVLPNGHVVVATHHDGAGGGAAGLKLYLGTPVAPTGLHTWVEDTTFPASTYGNVGAARAAVDPITGEIHVVAFDQQGRIDYWCNSGGAWVMSPVATGSIGGTNADIVLDTSGHPVMAFTRNSDNMLQVVTESCPAPTNYCTPGISTNLCKARVTASGTPSVSASSGFVLTCNAVEGQRFGVMFYGLSGRQASPWAPNDPNSSSYLCVKSPVQRIPPPMNSGGTPGQCNGSLSTDWLAFIASTPSALGSPFSAGDVVQAQAWYRDPPAPKTTNLSDAIEWTMCP